MAGHAALTCCSVPCRSRTVDAAGRLRRRSDIRSRRDHEPASSVSARAADVGKALGLRAARAVDVDDGRRQQPIGKREPRAADQHLAAGGDERAAVVDRAARFVAEQIGVGVAHAKRPRAFQHEPLANLLLGEREMAGAGVEQDVGPALGEPGAGAVGDPGVAADFEADPHAAAVEQQIADRILACPPISMLADCAGRPAAEPARLVVDAVARQVLLGHEAQQPAVAGHGRRVVDGALEEHRQAEASDHALRLRHAARCSMSSAVCCTPAEKNMSSQP